MALISSSRAAIFGNRAANCGERSSLSIAATPLELLSPKALAENLALVDQDILLFEGSIRDNLTLWNANLPLQDLERASK